MYPNHPSDYSLPFRGHAEMLAGWLAGPRGRLLRRAHIGRRDRVLEVGCGHGSVTEELARRARGAVYCIDTTVSPAIAADNRGARIVAADAADLPFAGPCFDLIFCQNVLMWVSEPPAVIGELAGALLPGGAVAAIEPDYGGMIEYPAAIALKDVWLDALQRAGAHPQIGRSLPSLCEAHGLRVWVELQNVPRRADRRAPELLHNLPVTDGQRTRINRVQEDMARMEGKWGAFVHVPYFLVLAINAQ